MWSKAQISLRVFMVYTEKMSRECIHKNDLARVNDLRGRNGPKFTEASDKLIDFIFIAYRKYIINGFKCFRF